MRVRVQNLSAGGRPILVWGGIVLVCLLGTGWARGQAAGTPAVQEEAKKAQTQPTPRTEQAYSLPPDKLAKAVALNKIRLTLDILGSFWGLAVVWGLLASRAATRLEVWTVRRARQRWVQGLLFFAVLIVFSTVAGLPLDLAGHVASRHYGISVEGWGAWFGDQGKGLGVSLLVGAPLLLFFNWIVRVSPRRYWVWTWLISVPLMVVSVFLAPLVLDPLFDKFEPLMRTHPQLVGRLEQVVARTGTAIPPDRMFLMKASAKTNGINAYVTGIGSSKRFVMWDTTTDRMPDDEILFIFGHESGHYVLHHIPKMLTVSAVGMLVGFWICAWLAEWMVRQFGARWQIELVAGRAGFLTLLLALSIADFVATPVSNAMSRAIEHQADVYGQEAIHGLVAGPQRTAVSAFNHLGESWLEDPNPSRLVEFWLYSHPSVQQRAEFAEHYDPWANGGHGKYFEQ